MTVSHDRERAETPRARADLEHGVGIEGAAPPVESGEPAPMHEAGTGRFVTGNRAWRRRQAKRLAKVDLAGINPDRCASWLRPYVTFGIEHATRLVASLPVQDGGLSALAVDTATAVMVYRALLALGAEGDRDALSEARAWLREHRLNMVALAALSRNAAADAPQDASDAFWLTAKPEEPST